MVTNPDTGFDLIELAQSWPLLAGAAVAQHQQQIQPRKDD
jgi:hypothetical protein